MALQCGATNGRIAVGYPRSQPLHMSNPTLAAPVTGPEPGPLPTTQEWRAAIERYQKPSTWRAVWQLVNTLGPIAVLWYLMSVVAPISLWLALPLAALVGALLVRVFIIFHDCGHGSFFASRLANDITGYVTGAMTFTPYFDWRFEHARHHATSGDLDKRGTGDIWVMTVQEYLESSRWRRFAYRLARNPFILFVVAPVFVFLFRQRFSLAGRNRREQHSVWWMNLALALNALAMMMWLGVVPYLVLQLVAIAVAAAGGVWLFYVQHQFEDAYWERSEDWDYTAAALRGSSYYALPPVLRWLSGNIGYHHIHHLSPRIPNYNLQRCHRSTAIFEQVQGLKLMHSFKSMRLHLWDEGHRRLVGFKQARLARRALKRSHLSNSES
jgi:omega-6 fatty acid desaturase (delta-12 desaturase)